MFNWSKATWAEILTDIAVIIIVGVMGYILFHT